MKSEIQTKKQKVKDFVKSNNFIAALRIAKSFFIEINKDEQRTIQIAFESLTGKERFYKQLGIDTLSEIEKSKEILRRKYA